jgi:DNA-binding NtrC family response regulator
LSASKSLLVVDDVVEILELFKRFAKSYRAHPLEVVTLSDPAAALVLVGSRDFDVIISDFRMPRVDGVSLLRVARAHNPTGLRVLMTGYNEIPVSEEEIESAALCARLKKPMPSGALAAFFQACFSDDPAALENYQNGAEAAM